MGQPLPPPRQQQAETLSIVAADRRTGEMGAAILSRSFSIGSRALWAEPGVGVVAAQGTIEPSYGPLGLALMRGGKSPPQALKSLLATDPRPTVRQVAMVDARGRAAAHTGARCLPVSGHATGRGFSAQANFVDAKRAWMSTAAAFRRTKGSLAVRLVSALEAGAQTMGGRRGRAASAALVVVNTQASGTPWEGKEVDLRVENSRNAPRELKALLRVSDAYALAESGGESLARGDAKRAEKQYAEAFSMAPGNVELRVWQALGLVDSGKGERGEAVVRRVMGRQRNWKALAKELASMAPRAEAEEEEGR